MKLAIITEVDDGFMDYKSRPYGSAVVHDGCRAVAVSLDPYTLDDLETIAFNAGECVQVLLTQAVRQFTAGVMAAGTRAAYADVCADGNRNNNTEAYA